LPTSRLNGGLGLACFLYPRRTKKAERAEPSQEHEQGEHERDEERRSGEDRGFCYAAHDCENL
jgi:hypothetical protein